MIIRESCGGRALILEEEPSTMTVTGLVEDGMIEENIPLSVSLFAETLWNPLRDDTESLRAAMIPM